MDQNKEDLLFTSKSNSNDIVEVVPLGGGCEVGRSCIILKFKGKNIMLDCGIHPSDNDLSSLPFFDRINPADIDLLLVTHFHLDHCGSLPYFLEKTNFKGRTYMTYPTKAIYKHLLLDSLKVGTSNEEKGLYSREDVLNTMEKIHAVNFHEEIEYKGIKFTAFNAGHVIGAAMFLIEISGTRILYTGDYSREEDMHIRPAEIPKTEIDILIVESTYGIKTHEPRERREKYFLETVEKIVKRNGKCLLPVFVLGRAQELLLLLEDYWAKKEELHSIPIYYASTLMAKCMLIFQTYINMMGKNVQDRMKTGNNPFDFKFISVMKGMENVDEIEKPMVVMASPGMLQKGLSRTLFQKWCHDERNGIVFTGYCVENTLARDILNGKRDMRKENGQTINIKISVEYVSFSAHADYNQTKEFIEAVKPKLVILVHGEKHEALRLKKELESYFGSKIKFEAPANWQIVEMAIDKKEKCKLYGDLVSDLNQLQLLKEGVELDPESREIYLEVDYESLLVKKNFKYFICRENDVDKIVNEKMLRVTQKLHIEFKHTLDLVFFLVQQIFPSTHLERIGDRECIQVNKEILLYQLTSNEIIIEWVSSEKNDIMGDCLGYFLYNLAQFDDIDMFKNDPFISQQTKLERLMKVLNDNFGAENVADQADEIVISQDQIVVAVIKKSDFSVKQSSNDFLKKRIESLVSA